MYIWPLAESTTAAVKVPFDSFLEQLLFIEAGCCSRARQRVHRAAARDHARGQGEAPLVSQSSAGLSARRPAGQGFFGSVCFGLLAETTPVAVKVNLNFLLDPSSSLSALVCWAGGSLFGSAHVGLLFETTLVAVKADAGHRGIMG